MRRASALVLVVVALALTPLTSGHSVAAGRATGFGAAAPTTIPPTAPVADAPSSTVSDNPFLPENANIGDCVSALPRPECGSKARGGWRQMLVFVAGLLAMAVIGVRLFVSVRRRDHARS